MENYYELTGIAVLLAFGYLFLAMITELRFIWQWPVYIIGFCFVLETAITLFTILFHKLQR